MKKLKNSPYLSTGLSIVAVGRISIEVKYKHECAKVRGIMIFCNTKSEDLFFLQMNTNFIVINYYVKNIYLGGV